MFENILFAPINLDVATRLRSEWISYVETSEELPDMHYKRIVDWADTYVSKGFDKDAHFYALTCDKNDGQPSVIAVMDVTHKYPNITDKFTIKVMSIHAAPHFDLRQDNTSKDNSITRKHKLSGVGSEIVLAAIDELFEQKASEAKIYCGSQLTVDLFESVAGDLNDDLLAKVKLDIDRHGSWLVISKSIR